LSRRDCISVKENNETSYMSRRDCILVEENDETRNMSRRDKILVAKKMDDERFCAVRHNIFVAINPISIMPPLQYHAVYLSQGGYGLLTAVP
jgi:hypothetical protein